MVCIQSLLDTFSFWCLYNFNGDFLNFEAPFDRRSGHSIRDHGNSSCFLFAHDDFLESDVDA